MPVADVPTRTRRRRTLAHTCPDCHAHWALRMAALPEFFVFTCRFCGGLWRLPRVSRRPEGHRPEDSLSAVPAG